MANYTMHHLNVGSDTYEIVDEQGRANIAPSFSASTAYSAGDYVIYSGKLYQFTTDHAAGAWTGADAEETTVAEDISQLKEDLKKEKTPIPYTVIPDSYPDANGGFPAYGGWDRTDYIDVDEISRIYVDNTDGFQSNDNAWYDTNKTVIGMFTVAVGAEVEIRVPENAKYAILSTRRVQFYHDIYTYSLPFVKKTDFEPVAEQAESNSAYLADVKASDINKIANPSFNLIESCNFSLTAVDAIADTVPAGSVGGKISFSSAEHFLTKKYKIPANAASLYTVVPNRFTTITDADGIILASGASSVTDIPSDGRYLYISASKESVPAILDDDIVWLNSTNRFSNVIEHTLYHPDYKSYYRDIIEPLWYDNIIDDSMPFVTEKDIAINQIELDNTSVNLKFFSNGGNGKIVIKLNNSVESGETSARLMYNNGAWHNIPDTTQTVGDGEQTIEWSGIDFASLIQYQSASSFYITFSTNGKTVITIASLTGKNLSNLSTYPLYSNHFPTMMQNVLSALSGSESASEQINLRDPNGNRFGLMITPSGELGTYKYVPNKMLIMGNSLVFGFSHGGESFGMAATSGENDFSYHLIEAIKGYNSNVSVDKLYSSPFEHAETLETAQSFLTDNTDYWNSDLDLVIIEMGDNVNSPTKRSVFVQSFPILLNKIRTQCPKARVVCVGIWFNNSVVHDIIVNNAYKYGCEFVDITPIRNSETEGELGATVYFKDGTTTTVTEGRVTHPGNLGMERIADAIIEKLDM